MSMKTNTRIFVEMADYVIELAVPVLGPAAGQVHRPTLGLPSDVLLVPSQLLPSSLLPHHPHQLLAFNMVRGSDVLLIVVSIFCVTMALLVCRWNSISISLTHRSPFCSLLLPLRSSLGVVATFSSISSSRCKCFNFRVYLSAISDGNDVCDRLRRRMHHSPMPFLFAFLMVSISLGYLPGHLVSSSLTLARFTSWL